MRKLIIISLLAILVNLFYLSVSHGQTSINVSGFVPQTELNKNVASQPAPQPVTKENKYQYFFEKALGLQANKNNNQEVQTIYDQVSSWGLMGLIMVIIALCLLVIIRFVDVHLFRLMFHKVLKKSHI